MPAVAARRFVAALVLALLAVLAPAAGATAAAADDPVAAHPTVTGTAAPVPTATEPTPEPDTVGPQATPAGRVVATGRAPAAPDDDPAAPPGPALDALLTAMPEPAHAGPAGRTDPHAATRGSDPGHGTLAEPRGPPATV